MTYRELCFAFYRKAQALIAPNLKFSQDIYEEVLGQIEKSESCWLDLGCGHRLLPPWRPEQEKGLLAAAKFIVGLDYDYESLMKHQSIKNKIRGDIAHLPFTDDSFDLITANMVFEHLGDPETKLLEILRILKPGGKLVFHTPNVWSHVSLASKLMPERLKIQLIYMLGGRKEEDIFPTFYRINSVKTITKTASAVGFEIDNIRLITSSAQLVALPPLLVVELLYLRLLLTNWFKPIRTNIIAILKKPGNK